MATIYEFPLGTKQSLARWPGVISATVFSHGIRQKPVEGEEGVFFQTPCFLVAIFSVGVQKSRLQFTVEGIETLHATLDLLVDAAHHRGQGFAVTDYSDGTAKLPESCLPKNQE